MLLANIEKLPDLPQQNDSQPLPSTEATHVIPNTDVTEPESAVAAAPEATSTVGGESTVAASENSTADPPSESAP